MKYLKKFNESNNTSEKLSILDEIKKFCELYLVYLLDDGFELDYSDNDDEYDDDYELLEIYLYKIHDDHENTGFTWNSIKDHYIPFLTLLIEKFDIQDKISLYDKDRNPLTVQHIDINKIINDEYHTDIVLSYICVYTNI